MANIKDNMKSYGKSWFKFDEEIGDAIDSKGSSVGVINGATKVLGWGAKGKALSLNGTTDYVQFSSQIIPQGKKSIRVKFKTSQDPSNFPAILSNGGSTIGSRTGIFFGLNTTGKLIIRIWENDIDMLSIDSTIVVNDNNWHDVLFTWDGTTNTNMVKLYIDDMIIPNSTSTATSSVEPLGVKHLILGKADPSDTTAFNGLIDELEIYNEAISVIPDKILILNAGKYLYYNDITDNWVSVGTTVTGSDYIKYGMNDLSVVNELAWKKLIGSFEVLVWTDYNPKSQIKFSIKTDPFTLAREFGDSDIEVIEYTDNPNQNSSTVITETEPFTIYDEMGDSMDVLYYTDNQSKTSVDLELTANYTPLDELEGDFEIVGWTNEDDANKSLDLNAQIYPKFVKLTNPISLQVAIQKIQINEPLINTRYLFSPDNNVWKTWNGLEFDVVDTNTIEDIIRQGMTFEDVNKLTPSELAKWDSDVIYLGLYLTDSAVSSQIDSISVESLMPLSTSNVSNTKLYILNTISTINVTFAGSKLTGTLIDEDSTKVQYRVLLNGKNYYPADGSFTSLKPSPLNISLSIPNTDILIDKENKLKIEFQDYWGKMDYWETTFIGTYSGLLFLDKDGKYYSTNLGEVLQNLNFGVLIAGQTSMEQSIILKNTHGFAVKDIKISANNTPNTGMSAQFSLTDTPFIAQDELFIDKELLDEEQIKFYVRLSTTKVMNPLTEGFDIKVVAKPVKP